MFIIERCKREKYIKAWNAMYFADKKTWNSEMFDGVNPSLNKNPLGTETDNFCTVIYDADRKGELGFEDFPYGVPVGIFSFVVTPRKIIGKQYVVHPNYQGKGLGKALLIENEKTLLDHGYNKYYIGCSQYSAGLIKKHWGIEPYSSDVEGDMYKFNVDLNRDNFNVLYNSIIVNNHNIKVVVDEIENIVKNINNDENSSITSIEKEKSKNNLDKSNNINKSKSKSKSKNKKSKKNRK